FDPRDDRGHNGACGACHNPHTQKEPKGAFASCATAGCHDKAETETPFHRGLPAKTLNDCGSCHMAHTWTVKHGGGACVDCHRDVMNGKPKAVTPAQRTSRTSDSVRAPRGRVGAVGSAAPVAPALVLPGVLPPGMLLAPRTRAVPTGLLAPLRYLPAGAWVPHVTIVPDSTPRRAQPATQPTPVKRAALTTSKGPKRPFSHPTHRDLACTNCHASEKAHGTVTVRSPAECASCHHAERRAISCEGCHERKSLAEPLERPVRMTLSAAAGAVREKRIGFRHDQHEQATCRDCHTQGSLLGVTKDCASCHTEHHAASANCASCHETKVPKHTRDVHDGCSGSGCHDSKTVATLEASRSVCLSCHQEQRTHKRGGECADCHPVRWTPAAAGVSAK
ncbi:MAG: hypothetical protein MUF00_12855, partial [Gemmatimonadaceae bacterium]|nr:hypothetical protein [Gemmatimonadaceae bacterium]